MRPEEFNLFSEEYPEKHKHIIVTNNIDVKNAIGEMSHVWMVTFWQESEGSPDDGIISFDEADRRIINLTHWKYA